MMAGVLARPKQRFFTGSREQVHRARDFIERALDGCPAVDDALLLTSELVTNAITHTASGAGGMLAVTVYAAERWVRVEVRDGGSVKTPSVRPDDLAGESGFGLGLVATLSSRWGHDGGRLGRVVWFELEWQ